MLRIPELVKTFAQTFPAFEDHQPWQVVIALPDIIAGDLQKLGADYEVKEGIAIHQTSVVETGVVLKAPLIIGPNCFIGAHAYLRGGVYLVSDVRIGTGCEIKSSIVFPHSAVAHFNFIGDSIIGSNVNFEAGSITANHFNERQDKQITVFYRNTFIETGTTKFGSLVGDGSKIGANAVLSPGTILEQGSIVKRLELI